jgi:hypothetical protein
MPAVEAVETNLHYLFASKRVMGEWMCFSDDELKQAIAKAKELAVQMQAIVTNTPAVIATLDAQPAVLQQFSWDKAAGSFVALALDGLKNASKHA